MSSSAWGSIELLVELVDRQFSYLAELPGQDQLMHVRRLLDFVTTEPELAGLLQELRFEASERVAAMGLDDEILREQLRAIWVSSRDELMRRLAAVGRETLIAYGTFDSYDGALSRKRVIDLVRSDPNEDKASERLAHCLLHWVKWALDLAEKQQEDLGALQDLYAQVSRLLSRVKYLDRQIDIAGQTSAWPAVQRLMLNSALLNPRPPDGDDTEEWTQHHFDSNLATELSQVGRVVTEDDTQLLDASVDTRSVLAEVRGDARLLHEELRLRLGLRHSRIAVVNRYGARCEAFDADRLRKLVNSDSRNAERHLTLDFARYLFDSGLSPIIDATVGALRPDILHLSERSLFYVEAKQYSGHNPRSRIKKAYGQVWSTWSRLRKLHPCNEAFLVVFRRSGRLVELPRVINSDGLKLYSVVVDLSKRAGSREALSPLRLSEAELLPPPISV